MEAKQFTGSIIPIQQWLCRAFPHCETLSIRNCSRSPGSVTPHHLPRMTVGNGSTHVSKCMQVKLHFTEGSGPRAITERKNR